MKFFEKNISSNQRPLLSWLVGTLKQFNVTFVKSKAITICIGGAEGQKQFHEIFPILAYKVYVAYILENVRPPPTVLILFSK